MKASSLFFRLLLSCPLYGDSLRPDFDADGRTDLIFFDPSGLLEVVPGAVLTESGASSVHLLPENWIPVANGLEATAQVFAADVDGDGRTDLSVYEPGPARLTIYGSASDLSGDLQFLAFQIGPHELSQAFVDLGGLITPKLVAIADFDADGVAEILVEETGTGILHLMNLHVSSPGHLDTGGFTPLFADGVRREVSTIGCFSLHDETIDLVLKRDDARYEIVDILPAALPTDPIFWNREVFTLPTGLEPTMSTDLNGDAIEDVLFFDATTGNHSVWTMAGPAVPRAAPIYTGDSHAGTAADPIPALKGPIYLLASPPTLPATGTGNIILGSLDANGDARDDLLIQEEPDGPTWLALMDGVNGMDFAPTTLLNLDNTTPVRSVLRNPSTGLIDKAVYPPSVLNLLVPQHPAPTEPNQLPATSKWSPSSETLGDIITNPLPDPLVVEVTSRRSVVAFPAALDSYQIYEQATDAEGHPIWQFNSANSFFLAPVADPARPTGENIWERTPRALRRGEALMDYTLYPAEGTHNGSGSEPAGAPARGPGSLSISLPRPDVDGVESIYVPITNAADALTAVENGEATVYQRRGGVLLDPFTGSPLFGGSGVRAFQPHKDIFGRAVNDPVSGDPTFEPWRAGVVDPQPGARGDALAAWELAAFRAADLLAASYDPEDFRKIVAGAGTGRTLMQTGNFNGDDQEDLLRKREDGDWDVVLLDGTSISQVITLSGIGNTNYPVAGHNGNPDATGSLNSLPPSFTGPTGALLASEGDEVLFEITATDDATPEGQLQFDLVDGLPPGAIFSPTARTLTWTPDELSGGQPFTVTLAVTDGDGLTTKQAFSINVTETNQAPVLSAAVPSPIPQFTMAVVPMMATDYDIPANPLTFQLLEGPFGAELGSHSGLLTWTPTSPPGIYPFRVEVSDGIETSTQHFDLTAEAALPPASFAQKKLPNDRSNSRLYAESLAISPTRLAVGAPGGPGDDTDAVEVYDRATETLLFTLTLPVADALHFGASLAISDDTLFVGAPPEAQPMPVPSGAVFGFDLLSGNLLHTLTPDSDDPAGWFGESLSSAEGKLAIGASSDAATFGAEAEDAVYLFDAETGAHIRTTISPLPLGSRFGRNVLVSQNRLFVGAPEADVSAIDSGAVYEYDLAGGSLLRTFATGSTIDAKLGLALAANNDTLFVSAREPGIGEEDGGAVIGFDRSTGTMVDHWTAEAATFGTSLAASAEHLLIGTTVIVQNGAGRVELFEISSGERLRVFTPEDESEGDHFGHAMAFDGSEAYFGAPRNEDHGPDSGSLYCFRFHPVLEQPADFLTQAVPFEINLLDGDAILTWSAQPGQVYWIYARSTIPLERLHLVGMITAESSQETITFSTDAARQFFIISGPTAP